MAVLEIILLLVYVAFSVGGATLVKYGANLATLFVVPIANMSVSWMTLVGILTYGLSFILYIVLLNRFDLSLLTPVATAITYTALMVISVLVFQESFTLLKTIGCILILAGVLLVVMNR